MSRCRLIYKSTLVEDTFDAGSMDQFARQCATNNAARNITGLLLLSGDRFLQVLEGPVRAVNSLFFTIERDPRHDSVTLITYEQLGPAYFSDWHMTMLDLYNLPMEPRKLFMSKYESHDGQIRIPDRLHQVYALLLDARAVCLSTGAAIPTSA
jgi:hypothetical protein